MARTSSSDGTEIAYRVDGDGEPLVLVHGTATSSSDWTFVLPHLRERFAVVAMDRRGRGRSGDANEHSMQREADDVLAVLDAVGGELLVGHSYGALCCILAAERSDRLRRLVLYEPPISIDRGWVQALAEAVGRGDHEGALAGFLSGAGVPGDQLQVIRSSRAWPVLLEAVPAIPRELAAVLEWRHPRGPIDVPALFLTGADTDPRLYLAGLDHLLASFARARTETLPGQRHIAHVLAPEAFAARISEFCAA